MKTLELAFSSLLTSATNAQKIDPIVRGVNDFPMVRDCSKGFELLDSLRFRPTKNWQRFPTVSIYFKAISATRIYLTFRWTFGSSNLIKQQLIRNQL